jgi:hypothetical protein
MFQIYRGGQFYWCRKAEYSEKTTKQQEQYKCTKNIINQDQLLCFKLQILDIRLEDKIVR